MARQVLCISIDVFVSTVGLVPETWLPNTVSLLEWDWDLNLALADQ